MELISVRSIIATRLRALAAAMAAFWPHVPFDFFGILFEDDYVEVIEGKDFTQLIGENSCQLLALLTRKKGCEARLRSAAFHPG